MQRLVLVLTTTVVALLIGIAATLALLLVRGGGVDEETYRQQVRPLLLSWQEFFGLQTFTCEEPGIAEEPSLTEEDMAFLTEALKALNDIYNDVQALQTPKRYRPGVQAMGAVAAELQTMDRDLNNLLQAAQRFRQFDPAEALADVPPTPENVSWYVRAQGAFETWSTDFEKWSRFIDCTLPKEPERVGELGSHMRQTEIDFEQLDRLRQEGPQVIVMPFAPLLDVADKSTQALARLSRAIEHQVEMEHTFADVIGGE